MNIANYDQSELVYTEIECIELTRRRLRLLVSLDGLSDALVVGYSVGIFPPKTRHHNRDHQANCAQRYRETYHRLAHPYHPQSL